MSAEKLPFLLPAVFTIGPRIDDRGSLFLYAKLISLYDKLSNHVNQFGLLIYNANVKQLADVRGHEYFSYLGQKTQMEAANQARVDVAEAKMKGEIGSKRPNAPECRQDRFRDQGHIYSEAGRRQEGRDTGQD